jgi:hypothetical protein
MLSWLHFCSDWLLMMDRLSLSSARGALMHELGRTGPESTTRVFPAIGMPPQ